MNKFITPSNYISLECFNIPERPFIYTPLKPTPLSPQGEEMVLALIHVSPSFYLYFNNSFDLNLQKEIASKTFNRLAVEWKANRIAASQKLIVEVESDELDRLPNKKQGKKYFETNRKFNNLVPQIYERTAAPRISAKGSTFHGMKKVLLLNILHELSQVLNVSFMELDMSAAHSRIALYLLNKENTDLGKSLKDKNFWNNQISLVRHYFELSKIDDGTIKKILKVGLYTSLNGGNPRRDDRIVHTLALNAEDYNDKNNISTISKLMKNELFMETKKALKDFRLIDEVQSLNQKCAENKTPSRLNANYYTYTVDRVKPYIGDSLHLGISRVLQGFEVVLLTTLVKDLILKGILPISLDHDGVLVMISNDRFEKDYQSDPINLQQSFIKSNVSNWSSWMLKESIPIEVKHLINKNGIIKFLK